jgi:hypothetical protein
MPLVLRVKRRPAAAGAPAVIRRLVLDAEIYTLDVALGFLEEALAAPGVPCALLLESGEVYEFRPDPAVHESFSLMLEEGD